MGALCSRHIKVLGPYVGDSSRPGGRVLKAQSYHSAFRILSTRNQRAAPSLEKERAQSGEHLIGVDGGILLSSAGRSVAFLRYILHLASDVALVL